MPNQQGVDLGRATPTLTVGPFPVPLSGSDAARLDAFLEEAEREGWMPMRVWRGREVVALAIPNPAPQGAPVAQRR